MIANLGSETIRLGLDVIGSSILGGVALDQERLCRGDPLDRFFQESSKLASGLEMFRQRPKFKLMECRGIVMSSGKHCGPENDPSSACFLRDSEQVYPLGGGGVSDGSQLEPMHRVIGAQCHVESLKTAVEDQVEGVLDIRCLLFGLLSADELNLNCVFEVAYGRS